MVCNLIVEWHEFSLNRTLPPPELYTKEELILPQGNFQAVIRSRTNNREKSCDWLKNLTEHMNGPFKLMNCVN